MLGPTHCCDATFGKGGPHVLTDLVDPRGGVIQERRASFAKGRALAQAADLGRVVFRDRLQAQHGAEPAVSTVGREQSPCPIALATVREADAFRDHAADGLGRHLGSHNETRANIDACIVTRYSMT